MSAVIEPGKRDDRSGAFALLESEDPGRVFAWREGRPVSVAEFLADVRQLRPLLPGAGSAINLCDDRYVFTAALCAAASLGRATLLPSSRARQAIADVQSAHAGACVLGDSATCEIGEHVVRLPRLDGSPARHAAEPCAVVPTDIAVIGFTSGSTGLPKPNAKTWEGFRIGSRLNSHVLCAALALEPGNIAHVVATVPAQHMYGMELSVLLPLFGPFAVHSGRPFFPADIARALEQIPAPRVLVTTPVHLRAILHDAVELPPLAAIVSATAPLSADLAAQAEARLGAPLIEMFGSTETCVIAQRRTARDSDWTLHEGVSLQSQPDGTLVNARHLHQAVSLQDIVEVLPEGRFRLCGRNADLLEIAGKRASLGDLTRRLLALDGVRDAVVFQLEAESGSPIQRIAALAVAPGRSERSLLAELRHAIDPLFLPRPLRLVDALPRNETGKLPRAALLAAVKNF
ncbi:AMP-binding protein [Dokdonella immobilis]|uniref:Acyl-coenzyme A synthetase/AMP-(Fatty) acid ligase n=1 Tax=Dokdonella immobilis TaxID=578942 RepID=A0A1I5ACL6_9GAMM|nr:AMP-binding protein [Dokdonella immobilis]SFN60153.1 Acyl-coenzyme A synthetase/AMP-(fatty) acid ligase [Dokdonella immobilis]